MAGQKEVAIRKRQQIDSSKKTMFFAVAIAAFLVGTSGVVSFFLVKQIVFHAKIISEKATTIARLDENKRNIEELKKNIRALETNDALNALKKSDDDNGLQPILDALPTEPNADALGASLQNNLAGMVPGLNIESLSIDPPAEQAEGEFGEYNDSLTFSLTATGAPDQLKSLLNRFERSIRVIDIVSAELQAGEDKLTLIIQGKAYYQPGQPIKLDKKVVKP